ncbi:flotillin-like protein FloA [Pontibacter sp. G13]|uniref:flotillin-like protein FloA n=1 Tax=Pontibacter sp. G13 TaxID=3074898 RepID=UPI00288B64D8|nr:flotillin-like protein FloA [Pontibacter sp. G13]WNJ20751.1 flotillin-like protein FloA [Pontibacter sp. G13]
MLFILLNQSPNLWVWIPSIIVLLALLVAFFYYVPMGLWVTARFSGVKLGIPQLIGMRLRRVQPSIIVEELIKASKAELGDVKFGSLEAHYLAKGNITTVVDALISAKNARIPLSFEEAAAIDLAGRNVFEAVKDSVNTKVIDSPQIEAVAKDGIQLIVKARITVRAHLDKLVGGAGEETVVARVGQGIVSAIGSAEGHEHILADPEQISRKIDAEGLSVGTAYEVLSIDIADVDIGKSIGAELKAEEAKAELQVARAKAEEKRAEAVAEEQYYKARVQEMRAKLIEAEAQVPMAIAEAFRLGNLGVMDYYRLQNMEADTKMRRSFSEPEETNPEEEDGES